MVNSSPTFQWDFFNNFTMSHKILEQENRMINEILKEFDFEKCQKVMKHLQWSWFPETIAPSIDRMKESARQRLRDAIDMAKKNKCSKSTYFSSSGGLRGNAWVNRFGQIEAVRLEFVLTEWDSDGDV